MIVKKILKKILPNKVKEFIIQYRNSKKTTEDIFTEIYENKLWGESPDGRTFCSGVGTTDPNAERYKAMLVDFIKENKVQTVFEIGCGDFSIMKEVLQQTNVEYTGIDIVKSVIKQLNEDYATGMIRFEHINAIEAESFPPADLCIIRQVLQHLTNDQIQNILSKTKSFKFLLITEHLPQNPQIINGDKSVNGNIRLQNKQTSGVFLDQAPFFLPAKTILSYSLDDEDYSGKIIAAELVTSLVCNTIE